MQFSFSFRYDEGCLFDSATVLNHNSSSYVMVYRSTLSYGKFFFETAPQTLPNAISGLSENKNFQRENAPKSR